jgi:hypothetical protein
MVGQVPPIALDYRVSCFGTTTNLPGK